MSYKVVNHIVTFINDSDLPVVVEGTHEIMSGLNQLKSTIVMPCETYTVSSITGEWFVTTYFNNMELTNMWKLKNFNNPYEIGKFRKDPCYQGDYSWMDTDKFTITREEGDIFRFNYS